MDIFPRWIPSSCSPELSVLARADCERGGWTNYMRDYMAQRSNRAFSHDVTANPVGVELFNWAACGEPSSKNALDFPSRGYKNQN